MVIMGASVQALLCHTPPGVRTRKPCLVPLLLSILPIEVVTLPMPIACPPPPVAITRQTDGTYVRDSRTTVYLISCQTKEERHLELWTDLPENGGRFIGVIQPTPHVEPGP